MLSDLPMVAESADFESIVQAKITSLTQENGPIQMETWGHRIIPAGSYTPADYTVTIPVSLAAGEGTVTLVEYTLDGGTVQQATLNADGALTLTLTHGPHTLRVGDAADVLVNNYTGQGTLVPVTVALTDPLINHPDPSPSVSPTPGSTPAAAAETSVVSEATSKEKATAPGKGGDLVYGVPGNPLCAETSVTLLTAACKREGIPYHLYSGVSFIDVSMASVEADPVEGLKVIDAFMIKTQHPDKTSGNLITQVYSQHIASEVKLALSDIYDDEVSVALIINGGIQGQEMVKWLPLYTMDRVAEINHLTSLYIPPQVDDPRDYQRLIQIMEILRGPDGCSWDKKQTHESLKQYLLEETYEVIDATGRLLLG